MPYTPTPSALLTQGTLVLALLCLLAPSAWSYRPFVSTDAAVAERARMEIELGYFTLIRTQGEHTLMIPQLVVNYGVAQNLELVAEAKGEEPLEAQPQLVDPALSLKAVLKEGILQEKAGASVAVEMGLLLPSTVSGEQRLGFEGVWGVITELLLGATVRLVGEVNGESVHGHAANNSGLLGVLWQPPWLNVVVDAGIRRGFSRGAPDWLFTTGLTVGFPLPASRHP